MADAWPSRSCTTLTFSLCWMSREALALVRDGPVQTGNRNVLCDNHEWFDKVSARKETR